MTAQLAGFRRTLLSFALVLAAGRPAQAAITDLVDQVGGYLASITRGPGRVPLAPGNIGSGTQQRLLVNGQLLQLLIGRTALPSKEVLDFYQAQYGGGLLQQNSGRPAALRQELGEQSYFITTEVRDSQAVADLKSGKKTLLQTGGLRMVITRQSGTHTDYIVARSEQPFADEAIEPPPGRDAPGHDLRGIPRPLGSVRGLSVEDPDHDYALVQYRVAMGAETAVETAVSLLRQAGFREDLSFHGAVTATGEPMRHLQRGNQGLLMFARELRPGAQLTYVSRRE